jgi:hypothetical protein
MSEVLSTLPLAKLNLAPLLQRSSSIILKNIRMPIPSEIVDSQGIKLYLGDIVIDEMGTKWSLAYDEEAKQFYFKMVIQDKKLPEQRLPLTDSKYLTICWKKIIYGF